MMASEDNLKGGAIAGSSGAGSGAGAVPGCGGSSLGRHGHRFLLSLNSMRLG